MVSFFVFSYLSLGAVVETASLAPPTPGLNSLSAPNSADIESAIVSIVYYVVHDINSDVFRLVDHHPQ